MLCCRRCDERDELARSNAAKDASLQVMSARVLELEEQVKVTGDGNTK